MNSSDILKLITDNIVNKLDHVNYMNELLYADFMAH